MKLFGKELKLLILNVDGVLLDLMACFEKNLSDAALELGLFVDPIKKYFADVVNGSTRGYSSFSKSISMLYPQLNDIETQKFKKIFIKKEEKNPYPAIIGSKITVFYFQNYIQIALCTTNQRPIIIPRLEKVGFNMKWFSYISSWESGHPKPDPQALTIITDSLKIPKEKALFVGDWYPDWECSKSAGIEFVGVLSGGIPKHAFLREGIPEDHIMDTLFDITKIIKP